uniref:Inhibitor of growth protein N-terminal histone-binding domain-containing protein n=1 Tax=Propithecus coquereli TaxID=379532 RepID=A0A2K6H0P3_PROCO
MLYLEDYLEMIEQLPMDLRDRFTEMREMDLQVQDYYKALEDADEKVQLANQIYDLVSKINVHTVPQ